jgi:hypothetical protein
MDKKKVLKVLTSIVPAVALGVNFLADYLVDKEKDEKYVSKEELSQLLKDQKESE